MDELTPRELGWLIENHYEQKKEHYELVAYAFQVGYVKAKTGKQIDMFGKNNKPRVGKVSPEKKKSELTELDNIFGN